MIEINLAKPKRITNRKLLDEVKRLPCAACRRPADDPAHVRSRGAGGDDVWENVLPLCREDHGTQHSHGWIWMIACFPGIAKAMAERGWTIERGKLRNPKVRG